MVNAATFINFMLSAGIIKLGPAQAAGAPAGQAFFTQIGFDAPTAQQLTTQLMSMQTPANPGSRPSPVAPVGGPRPVAPSGPAAAPTATGPAAAPRLTVLPTGYPMVGRS